MSFLGWTLSVPGLFPHSRIFGTGGHRLVRTWCLSFAVVPPLGLSRKYSKTKEVCITVSIQRFICNLSRSTNASGMPPTANLEWTADNLWSVTWLWVASLIIGQNSSAALVLPRISTIFFLIPMGNSMMNLMRSTPRSSKILTLTLPLFRP